MYVSDSYRAAFIHIPKTGGTAIRETLLVHMDCERVGTRHGTVRDLPYGCLDYFIFAVVRNPYHRLASQFRFRKLRSGDPERFLDKFPDMAALLENHIERRRENLQIPPICQSDFLSQQVTVYRYERFSEALRDLRSRFGIWGGALVRSRGTHYLGEYDWRDYMDRRALEIINDECREDFVAFGYDMLTWGEIRG